MTDPELFIVRIWHQLAGGFRASVRRVDEEQAHSFDAADRLVRFFEQVESPTPGGTDPLQPPLEDTP